MNHSNNARFAKNLEQENVNSIGLDSILSCKKLYACLPVNPSTIYRWVKDGHFPEPIRVNGRTTGWKLDDYLTWLKADSKKLVAKLIQGIDRH